MFEEDECDAAGDVSVRSLSRSRNTAEERAKDGAVHSSVERPKCKECGLPWRWPRNIAHTTFISDIPGHIKPTTQATVVAHLSSIPGTQPQATHIFKPGEMGITYDDHGFVKKTIPDSQAHAKGISEGSQIVKVGADYYTHDAVLRAQNGEASYEVTFKVGPPEPVICMDVFNKLELTQPPTDYFCGCRRIPCRLVEGFRYDHNTGDIRYGDGGTEAGEGYARLITLTSWYKQLSKCLRDVTLSVMDHYANVLLIFGMLYQDDDLWEAFGYSKYLFAVGWFTLMCTSFTLAVRDSWLEFNTQRSPSVGDLTIMCSWIDQVQAFIALVMFNFFMVENDVKRLPILLHPWKSIQPYAAVKIDGTRAFVLGYLDLSLFKVMNRAGSFHSMCTLQVLKGFVFFFKFYVAISAALGLAGDYFPYGMIFSCVSSVGSLLVGFWGLKELWGHRRILRTTLVRLAEDSVRRCEKPFCSARSCLKCNEMDRRQADAAKKILIQEYGFPSEKYPMSVKSKTDSACKRCGRDELQARPLNSKGHGPTPQIGDPVQVVDKGHHDARFGPLQEDQQGFIVRVVTNESGFDARCLVNRQAIHTFKPGEMGITYDDNGFVEEICLDGQARAKSLSKGDQIVKVGAEQFSTDAIVRAEKGGTDYEVTFKVSDAPPYWYDESALEVIQSLKGEVDSRSAIEASRDTLECPASKTCRCCFDEADSSATLTNECKRISSEDATTLRNAAGGEQPPAIDDHLQSRAPGVIHDDDPLE